MLKTGKTGDFYPSYHDWLGAHKTEMERERERDRDRWCPQQKRVNWVSMVEERRSKTVREREGGGREEE